MTEKPVTSTHTHRRDALAIDSSERPVSNANIVFFSCSTGIGCAAANEFTRGWASALIVGRGKVAGEAVTALLKSAEAASAVMSDL